MLEFSDGVKYGEIPPFRRRGAGPTGILACMRRALLIAVLAVLISDASGLSSLVVPESCAIGTTESAPDRGCPAFCVRCTCACCAASIEHIAPPDTTVIALSPLPLALPSPPPLPAGSNFDILHVPKRS